MDLTACRQSPAERERTTDLLRILPRGRVSVLDIGARDGFFSKLLSEHFESVTALDLARPDVRLPRVEAVAGDVTALQFPDDSFDSIFCAEVLEHILELEKACAEIARVARHDVVIGVPYRQDIRVGRTTCASCGTVCSPWGHVNSFTVSRLRQLFSGLALHSVSFVGKNDESTNALAAALMDWGGNPWGTYDQEEPCGQCGARVTPPRSRTMGQRICSGLGYLASEATRRLNKPHANWVHVVFSKPRTQ